MTATFNPQAIAIVTLAETTDAKTTLRALYAEACKLLNRVAGKFTPEKLKEAIATLKAKFTDVKPSRPPRLMVSFNGGEWQYWTESRCADFRDADVRMNRAPSPKMVEWIQERCASVEFGVTIYA